MSERLTTLKERIRERQALPPAPMRRALRKAAGLSLEELAAAVGVSRQAISYWERDERWPRPAHLRRYLEALETLRGES